MDDDEQELEAADVGCVAYLLLSQFAAQRHQRGFCRLLTLEIRARDRP